MQQPNNKKTLVEELIAIGYTAEEALRVVKGEAKEDKKFSLEEEIRNMLLELGIPASLQGFYYASAALEILFYSKNPADVPVTKELYPEVAKYFNTTANRVERCIRHAVEVAFERGDVEVLKHYFKNSCSMERGKATNAEFLYTLAYYLQLEENK